MGVSEKSGMVAIPPVSAKTSSERFPRIEGGGPPRIEIQSRGRFEETQYQSWKSLKIGRPMLESEAKGFLQFPDHRPRLALVPDPHTFPQERNP